MSDADELRRTAEAGALALEDTPRLQATIAGLEHTRDDQAALIAEMETDTAALQQLVAELRAQIDAQPKTWTRPTGPEYVRWEDVYRTGDTFQGVIDRTPVDKVLSLPAGEFWLNDGFGNGYRAAVRMNCKGIVAAGEEQTFIRHRANSTTARNTEPKGTSSTYKLIDQAFANNGVRYAGFTLEGGDQPLWYHGVQLQGVAPTVESVQIRGGSRGAGVAPPQETFSFSLYRATKPIIRDLEIDGRTAAGDRVASSPFGANQSKGALIEDLYVHHALAGSVTFWRCSDFTTRGLRCEHNGTGSGAFNGGGLNHELCSGHMVHERPTIITDKKTVPALKDAPQWHLIGSSSEASAKITLIDPTFDEGLAGPGVMVVFNPRNYYDGKPSKQLDSDFVVVTADGTAVPVKFYR